MHPQLCKSQLCDTLITRMPKVTVLLQYFGIGVCSIRLNDCSIRVFGQSSVYKSMGLSYPSKFSSLNTFPNFRNKGVRVTEDAQYVN